MGNLVFQATLGGQVNLVGPNTASTFNINVPTVNGNMVTTGDTGTVTNTMCATSVYTAPGTIGSGTPNTGAFTTLSASGVATISAGSASAPALTTSGDTNTGMLFPAADTIALTTGGTERLRLDSSGNLGLGVTPSAWNSVYRSLQIGSTAGISGRTDANLLELSSNSYRNSGGGWTYLTTSSAARYDIASGVHNWYVAASGTAGNAITFTQAMTLNASGYLGIGQTSPAQPLSVFGSDGSNNVALFTRSGGANMYFYADTGNNIGFFTGSNAAGGGFYANSSDSSARIMAGSAERARIDSSGNLLVGKTSASASASIGTELRPTGRIVSTMSSSANTDDSYELYSTGAGAYRFYVGMGGTIYATNTSISAISDIRFKENVRDLNVGLAEILTLKPRLYDWKEGKGANIKNARGFIAQEFEEVFPDLIDEWKDEAPEGEEPYKSVRQDLIPVLVKAIQELNAKFEAYKAAHP